MICYGPTPIATQGQEGWEHLEKVLAKYREKAWQQHEIETVEQYVQNSEKDRDETGE